MKSYPEKYPDFDHFLATEFFQDAPDIDQPDKIVNSFYIQYGTEQSKRVMDDVVRFLQERQNDVDEAFESFRPQIYPPGLGMTTLEWLSMIARLFHDHLSQSNENTSARS